MHGVASPRLASLRLAHRTVRGSLRASDLAGGPGRPLIYQLRAGAASNESPRRRGPSLGPRWPLSAPCPRSDLPRREHSAQGGPRPPERRPDPPLRHPRGVRPPWGAARRCARRAPEPPQGSLGPAPALPARPCPPRTAVDQVWMSGNGHRVRIPKLPAWSDDHSVLPGGRLPPLCLPTPLLLQLILAHSFDVGNL